MSPFTITTVVFTFQCQNCQKETNFVISVQKGWEIHNRFFFKLKDWPSLIIRDIWLLIFFLQSRGRPKTLWLYHLFGLSSFFNLFFWLFMYFGYSCWESQCYFVRLSLTEKKKRWVLNPMETLYCLHYQIFPPKNFVLSFYFVHRFCISVHIYFKCLKNLTKAYFSLT